MPMKPPVPCRTPGCPHLVPVGGECVEHPRVAWEGSTRKARLPGNWQVIRRRVLRRDANSCYVCGDTATEVDHIVAGDDHSMANLAAICSRCHRRKSSREGNQAKRHRRKYEGYK